MFPPQFIHNAIQTESRIMIESVCVRCGAFKVVSSQDRSLQAWEDRHECAVETPRDGQPMTES
jgi:hypothetical protein